MCKCKREIAKKLLIPINILYEYKNNSFFVNFLSLFEVPTYVKVKNNTKILK